MHNNKRLITRPETSQCSLVLMQRYKKDMYNFTTKNIKRKFILDQQQPMSSQNSFACFSGAFCLILRGLVSNKLMLNSLFQKRKSPGRSSRSYQFQCLGLTFTLRLGGKSQVYLCSRFQNSKRGRTTRHDIHDSVS